MTITTAPDQLTSDDAARLLASGRARADAESARAQLLAALRQHMQKVTVETPDPKFDRGLIISVGDGDDAWAVNVSLAASYAYVLREDTSQVELIHPGSAELFGPEQTLMRLLAEHGLQVLQLSQLQQSVDSGDTAAGNLYQLCFQEDGDAFWEFKWFAGEA